MFDVASSEVVLLGVVALLVIPPKDLPKAMRFAGHWVGKVRGVANQFRSGFDTMVREAELQEMEKKWAAENERIMREHPPEPSQRAALSGHPDRDDDGPDRSADATNAGVGYDGTEGDAPPVLVATPAVSAPPSGIGPATSDPVTSTPANSGSVGLAPRGPAPRGPGAPRAAPHPSDPVPKAHP